MTVCALIAWMIPATALAQAPSIETLRAPRGPLDPAIPAPESVLGFYPGADFQLADWPAILEYLQRLDESSDRMVLEEIGRSAEGQPLVMAMISSPENLARRDEYRDIAARLARAQDLSLAQAEELADRGKAIVWIDSGLHATEVAHGQHAPEFAYLLVAGESSELQRIRDDVIVLLMPNMNPDGLNIVADWYRSNLGTPYETSGPPVLYQKYAGHDNNRDWYMITQPETRAVARQLYEVWYPQIVYNHHQTAPFPARIFVPPFAEPANPNIPPLVLRGISRVGNAISTRLEQEGKSGVVSRLGFTAWWNGGMRTVPYFHNMVGILTETALFNYATPNFYPPSALPDSFRDGTSTREPSMKYPMPWPGGWWRLRDPIEYMLSASFATADVGSRYRRDWLLNIYRMGRDGIEAGAAGGPAGWIIPTDQADSGATVELINVLMRGGLEVHQADADFEAEGTAYPAGSYVVPAGQAFRAYAMDLLEPQHYPDRRLYPGGPPSPPYDMAGWTLPLHMGVDVQRIETPFDASTERVADAVTRTGEVRGDGALIAIDGRDSSAASAAFQLLASGATVHRSRDAVRVGADTWPAGTFLVDGSTRDRAQVDAIIRSSGVVAHGVRSPGGAALRLRTPRIGLYESWVANMDAGWTRYIFDTNQVAYSVLRDTDMRKGRLTERFDVIVLPSSGLRQMVAGHDVARMPAQFSGGLGETGVVALDRFVRDGGSLVMLDGATELALARLGAPATDALADLSQDEFFCPGSLLRIDVDTSHPIAFGMPQQATAFFVRSRAFNIAADALDEGRVRAVASYGTGELLESGWILGQEHLRGLPAVIEVEQGAGRMILIGFRAQFRAQPLETMKLLFNSLLYAAAESTLLP